MKRTLFLLPIIFCFSLWNSLTLVAQSDPSAIMNIESTDKGILIPRMTTAQRSAIATPAKGLLVFDNTTNGFWFYNGTDWNALDDNKFDGNVSIDGGALTILKPWSATGIVQLGGPTANPGITFRSNEPETYRSDIKMYKTGLVFATHAKTTIPTVRMSILNNGNVGIGTTEPTRKLHVAGDVLADNGWVRVKGDKGFFFEDHGGGFYMKDNTWIRTYNNKNFFHNTGIMRTDGQFQVGANGARFIVNTDGNVGVGTTEPTRKLHIAGDILADNGWVRVKGNKGFFFEDHGGGFYMKDNIWIRTYNNKNFFHNTGIMRTDGVFHVGANGARFIVNGDGKVGIGAITPGAQLHVGAVGLSTSDVALRVGGNGDVAVDASGVIGGRFVVKHGGNVGIGTNAPTSKLHVKGGTIRSGNSIAEYLEIGHGGANAYLNAVGDGSMQFRHEGEIKMHLASNGKLVIGSVGSTPGDYNLYVENGILTEHVRAALKSSTRWADDAFGKKPDLKELEAFIKEHSHLIGVPSAEELVETGIDMVEMDATLLRQIEWLWETVIEIEEERVLFQKKTLKLEKINKLQNEQIRQLRERMEKLEQLIQK